MKYSKFALAFLILAWLLGIVYLLKQSYQSVLSEQILTSSWPTSFLLSVVLASIGRVKEKTLFTKLVLIAPILSIVLVFILITLYARGLGNQF